MSECDISLWKFQFCPRSQNCFVRNRFRVWLLDFKIYQNRANEDLRIPALCYMPFESVYCIAGEVGICLLTFGIRPRPSPSSVMQQLGTSAVTSKFKQTFFFKMRHFLLMSAGTLGSYLYLVRKSVYSFTCSECCIWLMYAMCVTLCVLYVLNLLRVIRLPEGTEDCISRKREFCSSYFIA